MELAKKMGRRLAMLLLGIGVIVMVRSCLAPPSPPILSEEWQQRSWENLYTSIHLTARGDSTLIDSALTVIDTFFTRYTAHYSNGGPLERKILEGSIGDTIPLTQEELELLSFAQDAWEQSDGAIHPGIGNLLKLWGLTQETKPQQPSDSALQQEVQKLRSLFFEIDREQKTLLLKQSDIKLALGSFLKGWAIDRATQQLEASGVLEYLLEVGGDLRCAGRNPQGEAWHLGVRDPRRPHTLATTVRLGDQIACAMASSGGYAQFWIDSSTGERHHHILDPRTGQSARGLEGTTVIAPTALQADLFATWLFVVGPDSARAILERTPEIEGYLIPTKGEAWGTEKLLQELGR